MGRRKAVFFDIDGTLWDFKEHIPASTALAISSLRRAGHLVFINSGRTKAFIFNPALLSLGFDGIVSGCGCRIEYRDEVIYNHSLSPAQALSAVETFHRNGAKPILEGHEHLYLNQEDFAGDRYGDKLVAQLGERLLPINAHWGNWDVCKFSCITPADSQAAIEKELSGSFYAMVHNERIAEYAPLGYTKGTGIIRICSLLDIDISDTIAFGDSVNDLEMIKTAGLGIAMGNGKEELKKAAGLVTAPLLEDGIYKACEELHLF